MTKSYTSRDKGEVEVSIVPANSTATETVYPEGLLTSRAVSISSESPPALVRSSSRKKERLLVNEDNMSNILPVVELPPPPGIN